MEVQLVKDCADMQQNYHLPYDPWISACHSHMEQCEVCRQKFMPYFNAIEEDFQDGINILSTAIKSSKLLTIQCGQDGKPNATGVLVTNAANQILNDCCEYLNKYPDDNGGALVWLQKVFVVCRFFEAETRCQKNIPKKEKNLHVGKMTDDELKEFGTITTLSYLMKNSTYNTLTFNFELQKQTNNLLNAKEYYRALRLICDSPKHGVLSSILNLLPTIWAKQIYSIGLHALAYAMETFINEYRVEYNLSKPQK